MKKKTPIKDDFKKKKYNDKLKWFYYIYKNNQKQIPTIFTNAVQTDQSLPAAEKQRETASAKTVPDK